MWAFQLGPYTGMIEWKKGLPLLWSMAGLAGQAHIRGYPVRIRVTAPAAAVVQYFEEKHLLRRTAPQGLTLGLRPSDACCLSARMALLARDLLMQAGERKGRPGMAEIGSRSPGRRSVTVPAVGTELALMRLLVAGCALCGAFQIFVYAGRRTRRYLRPQDISAEHAQRREQNCRLCARGNLSGPGNQEKSAGHGIPTLLQQPCRYLAFSTASLFSLQIVNHSANVSILVGDRVMALSVTSQITALLAGAGTPVKVSEIRRSCGYDCCVKIHHRPIRRSISSDNAVRIVACGAAVTVVVAMRRSKTRRIVALVAQSAARGRVSAASASSRLLIQIHLQEVRIGRTVRAVRTGADKRPRLIVVMAIGAVELGCCRQRAAGIIGAVCIQHVRAQRGI
jgi:hypothetical protein